MQSNEDVVLVVMIWYGYLDFFNRGELRSGIKTGMQQGGHPRIALRSVGCVHLPWILWTQHRTLLLWQQYKIPTSTARRSVWLSHQVTKSSPQHAFFWFKFVNPSNMSSLQCFSTQVCLPKYQHYMHPNISKFQYVDLSKKSSPQIFWIQVCEPNHHHLNISGSTV